MTDKYSKKAESTTALTGGRRGKKENNNKNFASRKAFEEHKRQGRPLQVWMQATTKNAPVISDTMRAAKKGEVGAIPMKVENWVEAVHDRQAKIDYHRNKEENQ